jgi:nitrile hydratase subunit alpha
MKPRGIHDMGGLPAGKVESKEHDYAEWERRVDALMVLLGGVKGLKLMTVDELRKNIEALPPDAYEKLGYYERWVSSITQTLTDRGVVTKEELRAKEELGSYKPLTPFQLMETSLRELLVEKGILTDAQIDEEVAEMRTRTPERGARVVARAWADPAFKQRLLAEGTAACQELGLKLPALHLIAVENTPEVHNAIVCTLCSCYPRMLLGIPPDWYKSRNYRSRMVHEPRAVLAELGLVLDEKTTIRVHDSTADMRYVVLPMRPAGTEGWSEEKLASIVTRDCMIGVAVPQVAPQLVPKSS